MEKLSISDINKLKPGNIIKFGDTTAMVVKNPKTNAGYVVNGISLNTIFAQYNEVYLIQ